MNIFITGASGFIGGAIARQLRRAHTIKAMSRSERGDAVLRELSVEPVRCELGAVRPENLAGCNAVIHCAAFVEQWGTREQFWQANVEGARQLLDAARQAGVKRFIHLGTEAALFYGQPMREIDESYPYALHSPFLYSASKAEAERRVLAANAAGFETISIRPRLVWGPGDQTILPVVKQMVVEGRFRWMDGGRAQTSTTHIANLVHGVELALTKGSGGQAYFVTDDEVTTFREFLTALLKTQHITPPDKSIPGWLARALAVMIESIWKLFRLKSEPPLTRFAAAVMSRDCTIRIDRARRELGYEPVMSVERGMRELAEG